MAFSDVSDFTGGWRPNISEEQACGSLAKGGKSTPFRTNTISGPVSRSSTSTPNELAQTVATRPRRMPGTAREGFGL